MMTCADFWEQARGCVEYDALVHLMLAEWGCIKGDKPDMDRLRADCLARLEELDTQAVAA